MFLDIAQCSHPLQQIDDGYTVQFQARAIQQIALHAHEKVAPCSLSFTKEETFASS